MSKKTSGGPRGLPRQKKKRWTSAKVDVTRNPSVQTTLAIPLSATLAILLTRNPSVQAKVDVTRNPSVQPEYGVGGFPTLKWFVNGELSRLSVDARTSHGLVEFCKKNTGGTQFTSQVTCFTSAKVQIVTPQELLQTAGRWRLRSA